MRKLIIIPLLIFVINSVYSYLKYKEVTKEEIFQGEFQVINIYDKGEFFTLKLSNSDFNFFTSIKKEKELSKFQKIDIAFITTKIDFISYLKGFYAQSIYYEIYPKISSFKTNLSGFISFQHKNNSLKELFNALFLAVPLSKENRVVYASFGISHLIAISGFHLGILSFIFYWVAYFPYSYIHKNYFIYRNKKADLMVLTIVVLFLYLIFTNMVPSLFRAFVMFVVAFVFLRSNIKVLSFQSLAITLLLILCLFPQYIFSISLWFSIIGVFYIFLYLQYFKNLPKIYSILFFNIWIFASFNPIVHYIFYNTSYEQFFSPFLTLLFIFFYPIELFLHLISHGELLDKPLLFLVEYQADVFERVTPLWFLTLYVLISLVAVFKKEAFITLNSLIVVFNIYLYMV